MPLFGTRDVTPLIADAPLMDNLDAEPWRIERAEILHLAYEIDDRDRQGLLPKALHPTIPSAMTLVVTRYPDSPVGPFLLAQARISCRAAALPRGFLLQAYSDSAVACDTLGKLWGYRCSVADVKLSRYHDRITAAVTANGVDILRASLVDPEPISGGDIQYVANMNLARVQGGDPLLVQVDPEYAFHRAERGRAELPAFDRAAWCADGVEPVYPMIASFAEADTGFPAIRFVLDPDRPAVVGTRRLR